MDSDRWLQIHELFQCILEQPAAERAAYLDRVSGGDPELRLEVESLVAASADGGPFDRLLERFETGRSETDVIPDRVGPYRPLRRLGRGGMGVVYLAVRDDDQLGRHVALKVFNSEAPCGDLVDRFLAEREILARLDHPCIARLLSGGTTEAGYPYFAMEFIEGRPITDYCDSHRLGINKRLRLFLDVCSAVQHAHRHLIVHRDLKPANVLVNRSGEVRLLDFGIAKLLDERPFSNPTPLTRTGLRPMTPEYASPEQVRGAAVTTATDVYQLGILLFRLLTGRLPYRLPSPLLHEVERIICEEPVEKPSSVVGRPGVDRLSEEEAESPDEVARQRSTTIERLRRRLRGDLDTIVLMAMRKEPERRYASVEALADDIRRHLDGLPVRARPDTLVYRASKFVQRHTFGVVAITLVLLLVAGFALATAFQSYRLAQERDRAEEATRFMVELFQDFEPDQGNSLTTRELLDRRANRIRIGLRDQPLLQARLLDTLGQVYQLRGHFSEAERLLRESLAIRIKHLDPDHLDVTESRHHLGILLSEKDENEEAEPLLQQALAAYRRSLLAGDARLTHVLSGLATVRRTLGDLDGAEALFSELIKIARSGSEEMRVDLATALLFLGKIWKEKGRLDDAEGPLEESLALRRELFGEVHPSVANTLDGLGELLRARGEWTAAERAFREAYAIRKKLFETGHPDLAVSHTNLGAVLVDLGRYSEAEGLLRQALAVNRPTFGEQHILVREAMHYLGAARLHQRDLQGAGSLLQDCLQIWEHHWSGVRHPTLARTLNLFGLVHLEQGNLEAAAAILQRGLAMRRSLFPDSNPDLAESLVTLGRLRQIQGLYREAEAFYREGLAMQQQTLPAEHRDALRTQVLLENLLTENPLRMEREDPGVVTSVGRLEPAQSRPDQVVP